MAAIPGPFKTAAAAPAEPSPVGPWLPTISGAPTSDPNDVVDGNATSTGAGKFSVTTKNAGVVSFKPDAQAVWEFSIVDMNGDTIDDADDFDCGDFMRIFGWSDTTVAPTDMVISFGMSSGPVANPTCGFAGLLVATAGRWRLYHSSHAGGSWSAPTSATTDAATTMGAMVQATMGTAVNQLRFNVVGLDATGEFVTTATSQTSPPSVSSQSGYDRMFVGVGWQTGVGGTPGTRNIGVGGTFMRVKDLENLVPFP